jgi:hypothetical protein
MTQDYVFGGSALKKIKIGDIISWSELADSENNIVSPEMRKRFGLVSKLEIVFRGDRKVGIVKVIPMGSMFEKEVLAVCVSLVSHQQFHDV